MLVRLLPPPVQGDMGGRGGERCLLGHTAQSQHVKADVADPHRLVQVKLDDGNLLYGALVTQQAATVASAEREREREKESETRCTVIGTQERQIGRAQV